MSIGTSSTERTREVKGEHTLLISRLLHFDQSCEKQLHFVNLSDTQALVKLLLHI